MSAQTNPHIKQIACLRRKSNLTRKEFFHHHFQVHGSMVDSPTNPDEKPHKYIQIHFFDAAFGVRPNSLAGTGNHSWTGRDDMTELYFRDWDNLKTCFESEHLKKTVGPDGVNFNDLETAIPLMVVEKPLQFKSTVSPSFLAEEGYRTVAVLFLASTSPDSGEQLEAVFSSELVKALQTHAADEAYGLQANFGVESTQFDLRGYFGGKDMPEYPVTYKIFMKDTGSVPAVRKAQKAFMEVVGDRVDESNTFIVFGKEGLLMDVENNIKFDPSRQPQLP